MGGAIDAGMGAMAPPGMPGSSVGGKGMGSLGNVNPETGQYEHGFERAWSGFTGKHPPSQPRLPREIAWMGPAMQEIFRQAAGRMNLDPIGASPGSLAADALIGSIDPTLAGRAFEQGVTGLGDVSSPTAFADTARQMRESLEGYRGFTAERGLADVREQGALTGNLIGTGTGRMSADYLSGLDASLDERIFEATPSLLGLRESASRTLMGAPGMLSSTLYEPGAARSFGQSQYNQQLPIQLLTSMLGAAGASPFYANQGTSGSGALGSALGAYMSGSGGKGGKGGGGGGGGTAGTAATFLM